MNGIMILLRRPAIGERRTVAPCSANPIAACGNTATAMEPNSRVRSSGFNFLQYRSFRIRQNSFAGKSASVVDSGDLHSSYIGRATLGRGVVYPRQDTKGTTICDSPGIAEPYPFGSSAR